MRRQSGAVGVAAAIAIGGAARLHSCESSLRGQPQDAALGLMRLNLSPRSPARCGSSLVHSEATLR